MKLTKNSVLIPIYALCYIFYVFLLVVFLQRIDFASLGSNFLIYSIFVFLLYFIVGIFIVRGLIKQKVKKSKIVFALVIYIFCFVATLIFADLESGDYINFLSIWYEAYQQGSLKDALNAIVEVSNYTPAYNYFLIILARLNINSLYGIKYITLIFSFLLAFITTKLIAYLKKSPFNYFIFVNIMLLPQILVEYSMWGQCDAIYTFFAILSFYYALKKKSKLSFLFLGLSFAFKMQFLFIVPIIFVLLLIKDSNNQHYLKWKDIWIAPVMYAINLLPVLTGTNVLDLLLVYVNQTTYDPRICANCPNICYFYSLLGVVNATDNIPLLVFEIILTLVLLVLILILAIKYYIKYNLTKEDLIFFSVIFSFVMVFFMPKMMERFYYIPSLLAIVLFVINDKLIYKFAAISMNFAVMLAFFDTGGYTTLTIIGSIINIITFVLLVIILIVKYFKPLMRKPTTQPQEDNNNSQS